MPGFSRLGPILLLCLFGLSACVQFDNKRGVEVAWQDHVVDKLVRGESSRKDVLEILGPPSQVIALDRETVLYYLFEKARGQGIVLVVYNSIAFETHYDRAIFFFDDKDVLTDYAARVYAADDR